MRKLTSVLLAALIATSGAFYAQPAFAQSKAEQVEKLSREGAARYRDGDYEGAIELFSSAHEIEPVPNLLFNIAKCHEKLENWDDAITYYQRFIVEGENVDKKARQAAMDRIDALNEVKSAAASEETKGEETEKTEKTETAEKTEDTKVEEPPPVVEEPDNTWAWVSLGTGVVLLGGGATFGLLASQKQTDFEQGETMQDKVDARDSGETFALVADGMYVAGAIFTGVGLVLLMTGDEPESEGLAAGTFGWFDENGAGVGLRGSF